MGGIVGGGQQVSDPVSSVVKAALSAPIPVQVPPPVRSTMASNSHKSSNPITNHTCKGSRFHTPYENPVPDDPRWS